MRHTKIRRVLCMLLSVLMVSGFFATAALAYNEGFESETHDVFKHTESVLAPGVDQYTNYAYAKDGKQMVYYVATAEISRDDIEVHSTYKDAQCHVFGMSKMTEQISAAKAKYQQTNPNFEPIIGTNANFYNMRTGQPTGAFVMDGEVVTDPSYGGMQTWFAVFADKTALCGTGLEEWNAAIEAHGAVQQAVGGSQMLVIDGQDATAGTGGNYNTDRCPRTSVGVTADNRVVMAVLDGRQEPFSCGGSVHEMAQIMLEAGCVAAINLDGGGSSTFVARPEGENEVCIINRPSDGTERTVSNGLLIASTARSTGEFDHASVTPNNEYVTAGHVTELTAIGIDSSGNAANAVPETVQWQFAESYETMGTISEQTVEGNCAAAKFTSSGILGEVKINLIYEEAVVGTSVFSVVEPDSLQFAFPSVSLDFGESSDLGLAVTKDGRDVLYGDNDFTWTITSTTPNVTADQIGTMNGNIFTAGQNDITLNGTVTVRYKEITAQVSVEIGKMPFIALDFEADENGNLARCGHYDWGNSKYIEQNGGGYVPKAIDIPIYQNGRWTNDTQPDYIYHNDGTPVIFDGNWGGDRAPLSILYADGYSYYLWPNGTINEYEVGNIRLATREDGAQVMFGDSSLELNYDYRNYDGTANSNFNVRYCGDPILVPGAPKQVGAWVYADENSYGIELYMDLPFWDGTEYAFDYVHFAKVNWVGWKYVSADIKPAVYEHLSDEHPLGIFPGPSAFWVSYQPGSGLKRTYGTLYIDNLRFVYGTDKDDLVNPVIDSITAEGTELSTDVNSLTVIDKKDINFNAFFNDPESDNRSGIDATSTTFKIDGNTVNCDGDETTARTYTDLINGIHSINVTVYDNFGNFATETRYFIVDDRQQANGSVVIAGDEAVTMGSPFKLYISSVGAVSEFDMNIYQLNTAFGAPTVTVEEGWELTKNEYREAAFKLANFDISAKYTGSDTPPADSLIATLTFEVPGTIDPELDFFTYYMYAGIKNSDGTPAGTCAHPKVKMQVQANCVIEAGLAIEGYDTLITVKDLNGQPVVGSNVYLFTGNTQDKLIGATDENGQVTLTDTQNTQAGSTIYVQVKNGPYVSYRLTVRVLKAAGNEDGTPSAIKMTVTGDLSTTKTITWLSKPGIASETPAAQYVTAAEYDSGAYTFSNAVGSSVPYGFYTNNTAAYINKVEISNLTPDTEYCCRFGDGTEEHWSEIHRFKTAPSTSDMKFIVIGDTQMTGNDETDAPAMALLQAIGSQFGDVRFGIQTGDYVDNGGNSHLWEQINDAFDTSFAGMSFVQTIGNHESFGDASCAAAMEFFAMPDVNHYSVEQGDVYIANISYGKEQQLRESLEWMINDANASDAEWKILVIHQPAYYTNINGGNDMYHELVPPAADAAGIDVVFQGHDHSYARTYPLTAGEICEDGIVYYICGDLGEKSRTAGYEAVDNPEFHFAMISQEYDAMCIECEIVSDKLTIRSYDVDENGKTEIDSYSVTKHEYDFVGGVLKCTKCGELFNGTWTDGRYYVDGYVIADGWLGDSYYRDGYMLTGLQEIDGFYYDFGDDGVCPGHGKLNDFYYDETVGAYRYFTAGIMAKGEVCIYPHTYFFDEDGIAISGERDILGYICQFSEKGAFVSCTDANVKDAGFSGTNIKFVLLNDGTLKVDGEGEIKDYTAGGIHPPWFIKNGMEAITALELGNGITRIGEFAFFRHGFIKTITFESNSALKTIAKGAFQCCWRLTTVTIPASVETLEKNAFLDCSAMTTFNVEEPSSLKAMRNGVLMGTSILETAYIPGCTTEFAGDVFYDSNTSLVLQVVENSAAHYYALAHNLNFELREGVVYPIHSGICTDSIEWNLYPDGSLKITGSGAIPDYTSHSQQPWGNYRHLIKKIVIGKDITSIGNYAFCYSQNVETVEFEAGSKLTRLGVLAFRNLPKITDIVLPDGVTRIETYALSNCFALVNVYIPQGTSFIYATAFDGSTNVVLNVAEGTYAEQFAIAYGIQHTVRDFEYIPLVSGNCGENAEWAFYGNGELRITGSGAMADYTSHGQQPWAAYRHLIQKIVIGKDITSIGNYAFCYSQNVETVEFEAGSKLTRLGILAFRNLPKITDIVLPESVTHIEAYALSNCFALTNAYIPQNTCFIHVMAFDGSTNVVLNVAEGTYAEQFAEQYNIAHTSRPFDYTISLASGNCGENAEWAFYGNGELRITGSGAMADYTSHSQQPWGNYRHLIKKIVIGKDITSVGNYAFCYSQNVETVEFEEGSKLTRLGILAFRNLPKITDIVLPESVTHIEAYALSNCVALATAYIPQNTCFIHAMAFNGSTNVVLNVAEGTYAEQFAEQHEIAHTSRPFDYTISLASGNCGENAGWVFYGNGELRITGSGAMEDYTSHGQQPWAAYRHLIKKIVIGRNITSIGNYAFAYSQNVESVEFNSGSKLTRLGVLAFCNLPKIKAIILPDGVTRIEAYALGNCYGLGFVYIPDGTSFIYPSAFQGSTAVILSVAANSYALEFAQTHSIVHVVRGSN